MAHYLNQAWVADRAHQLSAGIERPRIEWKTLSRFPIAYPGSKEDQRAIVDELERIERLRCNSASHLEIARSAVERLRQAELTSACSGQLTADWRIQNPELARRTTVERPREGIQPLVETPDEWVWNRLEDITDIKGGIQKGAKSRLAEPSREVPYLRVANVQRGWLDLSEMKTIRASERKIRELRLEPGDILFNEGGDRDKLGRGWVWEGQIEECIHQNHVFRARLRNGRMQPRFFSWYGNTIGTSYFNDEGRQTVNLASLSMRKLRELPVPVPGVEEQAEIARRVDALLTAANQLLARIDTADRLISRSSQSVLAKAFRGCLVLSDPVFAIEPVDASK